MRKSAKSKSVNHFERLQYHTKVCPLVDGDYSAWWNGINIDYQDGIVKYDANLSFFDKVLVSFFQTVTMRTAGFATIDCHDRSSRAFCFVYSNAYRSSGGLAGG